VICLGQLIDYCVVNWKSVMNSRDAVAKKIELIIFTSLFFRTRMDRPIFPFPVAYEVLRDVRIEMLAKLWETKHKNDAL
jgi:hypothetical protein